MTQRPLRSTLAALLLGATLLLPWLAGTAAGAAQPAPRRPAAVVSVLPEPLALLWQALVQLVCGSSAPGSTTAPRGRVQRDPGHGLVPYGHGATGNQGDSGCSTTPDGGCGS